MLQGMLLASRLWCTMCPKPKGLEPPFVLLGACQVAEKHVDATFIAAEAFCLIYHLLVTCQGAVGRALPMTLPHCLQPAKSFFASLVDDKTKAFCHDKLLWLNQLRSAFHY